MQEEFADLVGELRASGTTVFLSTHNLPEVERMCDRVALLRDGRLVAVETVAEITGRGFRHVTLVFGHPVAAGEFGRLDGVENVRAEGPQVTFTVTGDLDGVLRTAGRHRVVDMEVARPSLEEAFVAFYDRPLAEEAPR
jgi:ABC-2 type transport system ATP-binding protein